jgi:hypothetical protein
MLTPPEQQALKEGENTVREQREDKTTVTRSQLLSPALDDEDMCA